MENNKKIVEKAKKTLESLGYDVKTTHLYEFFSKMSDFNSYSVAKAKDVDFKNVLLNEKWEESNLEMKKNPEEAQKLQDSMHLLKKDNNIDFKIDKIIELMKLEKNKDLFFLGFKDQSLKEPNFIDFFENSNIVIGCRNEKTRKEIINIYLLTWMAVNSNKTQLFLINTLKNVKNYSFIKKDLNSYKIESTQKANKTIDLIWEEFLKRQEKSNMNLENNKIITLIENTAFFLDDINYVSNKEKENSSSFKLLNLLRNGRKFGIYFILEDSSISDIPKSLSVFCQNKIDFMMKFKVNDDDLFFPNLEIMEKESENFNGLFKNLNENFLFLTNKIIKEVIEGNSLKEFYKNKKMSELMASIESHDAKTAVSVLHEKIGHKVREMEEGNNLDISHIVYVSDDIKIAVITRAKKDRNSVNAKHINHLMKAMEVYECTKGIIYTSSLNINRQIYKMAKEFNIEIVDYEDLIKFAIKIDSN